MIDGIATFLKISHIRMNLFIITFVILMSQVYTDSNYNADYPNIKICVLPNIHPTFMKSKLSYTYLKRMMGLNRGCTHIRGTLHIESLTRYDNGTDPDLSFLETIEEISGALIVHFNTVRRIPLGNLKVIRGLGIEGDTSLDITYNSGNSSHFLEILDLHSLRAVMKKNVVIYYNTGLDYITHNVDWKQILADPTTQKVTLPDRQNNYSVSCHSSCDSWTAGNGNKTQYCFGPSKNDCQPKTKCLTVKGHHWCQFSTAGETACDRQCAGGCSGNMPENCTVCNGFFKKNQCVSTCAAETSHIFGDMDSKIVEDKLIYSTGGLCTSHCPDSLMDQEKRCVYLCDFTKFYKNGNRCIECPNQKCYTKIGDQLLCDLKLIDPQYPTNGRKYSLKKAILQKLTNCTIIVGQLLIEDISFSSGITTQMLYDHLKNVREVIGELKIHTDKHPLTNLTFLSNLREIRGAASINSVTLGLSVFVKSLEFLGLKKLEKVYGMVNLNYKSNLCYDDTIPWTEITQDEVSPHMCAKKCHALCTRGCWGPGNDMCYKCTFMEAGDFCVKNCSDTPGYYLHSPKKNECRKCHFLCKNSCSGPLSRDCTECRFAKENGECVSSCSLGFYFTKSTKDGQANCMPCHRTCYIGDNLKKKNFTSACSGPSNQLAPGGCEMCNKIIQRDNSTQCHLHGCPRGYFEAKIDNSLSIQRVACYACDPLCETCLGNGTERSHCTRCKGFWSKDVCYPACLNPVRNVTREVKPGDNCPTCHMECRNGCQQENDNNKCHQCTNNKLFKDVFRIEFSCVETCPPGRNYTDYVDGDFLCLTYAETAEYLQRRKIVYVVLGSLACFVLTLLGVLLLFRYKFQRSKIQAELKAFYSNFNEPSMKNRKDEHSSRAPNMNRLQMIPISDLIFDSQSKPLGAGAFGKVFRGYWKVPGPDGKTYNLDVVVKVIHNTSKSSTNEFLEEAQIMASVSHLHCLPLIGVCLSLEKPCLVSSFAEFGSLEKYLHTNSTKISSYSMVKWSEQIADGMAYLNMRGIIHRDLAARNILVSYKNIVQITDFGLARLVDDTNDGIVVRSGRVPIRWLALETLLYANYSAASDVWAYGVTLWEIFTYGGRPYEDLETSKVKAYLQEGNRLFQPDICTLEVYMVMIKCWLEDPQMRPSFYELITTFDQFSHNSKRYLCIPHEHDGENMSANDVNPELICLNQISPDSACRPLPQLSNRSDDNGWISGPQDDSAAHLINRSYNTGDNDDFAILPKRKKTKKEVSFDRLKKIPKLGLMGVLSNKSQDSKSSLYRPSSSYHSDKNLCLSYDSTTAIIDHQRSHDSNSQPINPRIAKLMKQEDHQIVLPSKNNSSPQTERIFNDKDETASNQLKSIEQRVVNRSPSLPPIDLFRFVSKEPSAPRTPVDVEIRPARNSPDSGNSHDFEMEDCLTSSRIQSAGYYNITPSPSTVTKPIMDLSEALTRSHNDSYNQTEDDGYMEPISKSNR